jgi:hypothetical protein
MADVDLPDEVARLTDEYLRIVDELAPGLVTTLLLHGSLCWGEFFVDSDVDFVAIASMHPSEGKLRSLASVHERLRGDFPQRRFEGFYCQAADLAAPPIALTSVPAHYDAAFDPAGRADVNLVTWHELAERGIAVRGDVPTVYTDLDALIAFSRRNLTSYWTPMLKQIEQVGDHDVGERDSAVAWVVLGVARLHHLLARKRLTSKSGAGRYVLDALEPHWHRVAHDALAVREKPGSASHYNDLAERGRDVREFLAWAIEDGERLGS